MEGGKKERKKENRKFLLRILLKKKKNVLFPLLARCTGDDVDGNNSNGVQSRLSFLLFQKRMNLTATKPTNERLSKYILCLSRSFYPAHFDLVIKSQKYHIFDREKGRRIFYLLLNHNAKYFNDRMQID